VGSAWTTLATPGRLDSTSSHPYAPRELMAEGGDSLSSTLAGLRETGYYDYNIPKHTEI